MATPIRVLCVDDHRLMREGIARIVGVQPDMTVVAEASDGEEAVERSRVVVPERSPLQFWLASCRPFTALTCAPFRVRVDSRA